MIYLLDDDGRFVCEHVVSADSVASGEFDNWTREQPPQPCHRPRLVGKRSSSGEWLGDWLDDGEAPPSEEARKLAIRRELAAIDSATTRPLRAVVTGSATDEDRARLEELDRQAAALRLELSGLA